MQFKRTLIFLFIFSSITSVFSQTTQQKREMRKNLTIIEWNTEGTKRWMDHLTVYNPQGLKIEEIEYAIYGQKERVVSEYDSKGRCIKEIVYDDRNKPTRIRKYEYNENGTKKKQYNYLTNGKLFSVKVFEYISTDN